VTEGDNSVCEDWVVSGRERVAGLLDAGSSVSVAALLEVASIRRAGTPVTLWADATVMHLLVNGVRLWRTPSRPGNSPWRLWWNRLLALVGIGRWWSPFDGPVTAPTARRRPEGTLRWSPVVSSLGQDTTGGLHRAVAAGLGGPTRLPRQGPPACLPPDGWWCRVMLPLGRTCRHRRCHLVARRSAGTAALRWRRWSAW
jgi:hypothetical protein